MMTAGVGEYVILFILGSILTSAGSACILGLSSSREYSVNIASYGHSFSIAS